MPHKTRNMRFCEIMSLEISQHLQLCCAAVVSTLSLLSYTSSHGMFVFDLTDL